MVKLGISPGGWERESRDRHECAVFVRKLGHKHEANQSLVPRDGAVRRGVCAGPPCRLPANLGLGGPA